MKEMGADTDRDEDWMGAQSPDKKWAARAASACRTRCREGPDQKTGNQRSDHGAARCSRRRIGA